MTVQKKSLLPLTSDFVFKAVYGQDTPQSREALRALLNCLLDMKDKPIQWVRCENPFVAADHITGKEAILDIKACLSSGQLVDLEMQVNHLQHFINRSIFYMGKLITSSLDKGQNYGKMKPTIVISIVDGVLFQDSAEIHSRYTLHEKSKKKELSDLTQIHFLELGKIDLTKPVMDMTPYERIGAYFKCASDDSRQYLIDELLRYEPEVITLTEPIFKKISYDDRMRDLEEAHDKYLHDMATLREEALESGRAEGLEKGLAEGRAEGLSKGRAEGETTIAQLHAKLIAEERFDDLKHSCEDKVFRDKLLVEYNLK